MTYVAKMTIQGPTNKAKNSSVGLVQSRGKLLPTDTQELFRAIVIEMQCVPQWPAHRHHPPLHPSHSASRSQLAPPAPSPLAHKLLHAAAELLIATENAAAAARSACLGSYPVSPASPGLLRYALCPLPPLCFCSVTCSLR
jgi:hypothetical protein